VTGDDKTQKVSGVASNGEFWVSRALGTIEVLGGRYQTRKLVRRSDEDDQAVHVKAQRLVETLKKMPADQQDTAKGAELLLSAIVLQQYTQTRKTRTASVGGVHGSIVSWC